MHNQLFLSHGLHYTRKQLLLCHGVTHANNYCSARGLHIWTAVTVHIIRSLKYSSPCKHQSGHVEVTVFHASMVQCVECTLQLHQNASRSLSSCITRMLHCHEVSSCPLDNASGLLFLRFLKYYGKATCIECNPIVPILRKVLFAHNDQRGILLPWSVICTSQWLSQIHVQVFSYL